MIWANSTSTPRSRWNAGASRLLSFAAWVGAGAAATLLATFSFPYRGVSPLFEDVALVVAMHVLALPLGSPSLRPWRRTLRPWHRWYAPGRFMRDWFGGTFVGCVGVALVFQGVGVPILESSHTAALVPAAFVSCLTLVLVMRVLDARSRTPEIGLIGRGRIADVAGLTNVRCHVLDRPTRERFDAVVADLHHAFPPEWDAFLADCHLRSLPVLHAGLVHERFAGRVSLRYVRDVVLDDIRPNALLHAVKRVTEVASIITLAPLWLPLMAATAAAVRLESSGPVLFWQERVGLNGARFHMVKFRSMTVDAERRGAAFATAEDVRVTRVGRFIRRFRMDELPQLYNVIRGEMSLIGPRPEQVPFATHYETTLPFYAFRHRVRPGLTGWAQVRAGYAGSDDETRSKLEYDLFYVKNLSPWLDAWIVILTLRTIVTGFGAR